MNRLKIKADWSWGATRSCPAPCRTISSLRADEMRAPWTCCHAWLSCKFESLQGDAWMLEICQGWGVHELGQQMESKGREWRVNRSIEKPERAAGGDLLGEMRMVLWPLVIREDKALWWWMQCRDTMPRKAKYFLKSTSVSKAKWRRPP